MFKQIFSGERVLLLGVAFEGGLGLLAWAMAWLVGQPLWEELHWDLGGLGLGIAVTLPMLALFLACLRWPIGPLARIKQFSEEVVRPLFGPCSIFDLALIALLAGFGEELFFRGFCQELLSNWLTPWGGVAVASILFGLMHPITPAYVVLATVLGIYLGVVQLTSENLLVVIVAHALYDWLALLILLRQPAAGPHDGRD
jgi:membrane protease YdiL (CAAX protease family)